ncbi:MAG: hypothetical protein MJ252_23000 [archaeon]|nr:hypothetical protein [archaeon]
MDNWNNTNYLKRLKAITDKKAKPKLNLNFIQFNKQMDLCGKKKRNQELSKIQTENKFMCNRLLSTNAFLQTKKLDNELWVEHENYVARNRKYLQGVPDYSGNKPSTTLPLIKRRKLNYSNSCWGFTTKSLESEKIEKLEKV